jgi:hypothetical protein
MTRLVIFCCLQSEVLVYSCFLRNAIYKLNKLLTVTELVETDDMESASLAEVTVWETGKIATIQCVPTLGK